MSAEVTRLAVESITADAGLPIPHRLIAPVLVPGPRVAPPRPRAAS
jgi:hypothetical protein